MVCVDASVVAKLLFEEEDSDKARALFAACGLARQPIIAPPLLPFEITNAVRRRMRNDGLGLADARILLEGFNAVPISGRTYQPIHVDALALASDFDLGATYDAHYVVLARRFACNLWTADLRLLNSVGGRLGFVRSLATFSAQEPV